MPEQLPSSFVTPDQKRSFPKAVTEGIFRSSKLRAKVKQLRRALSVKKKSVNLRSYSPVIFKNVDCHGSYGLSASPLGADELNSSTADSLENTVDREVCLMQSLPITDLTEALERLHVATNQKTCPKEHDSSRISVVSKRPLPIQHDSTATCVVELFPDNNNAYLDKCAKQAANDAKAFPVPIEPESAISPPVTLKTDLYTDVKHFEKLDRQAIMVARRDYTDSSKLLRDLTENCNSELDKVRVIFRWVIAMDRKIVRDSNPKKTNVIGSGGVQCQKVFKRLCREVGLHSEIILGYSKGAGHRPGMPLHHKSHRNSWNAVAIDGTWRFVNCTWAARHVTGNPKSLRHLQHKYDEFYFLTDPKEHIYQHFPDDPKWQLLDQPLSLEEFTNLPSVKSPFFKHGLQFSSSTPAILKTRNDSVEVRLKAPYGLEVESRLEMCELPREHVTNHVLHRRVGSQIVLTVVPPHPGSYYLSMYAGSSCTSDVLECVFSLRIVHSPDSGEAGSQNCTAYPPVSTLGPTPLMSTLGVSTNTHHDPLINMVDNTIQIDFNVTDDVKFTHSLQYYDSAGDTLVDIDRYAFARHRTDSELSFSVACPRKGSYIFCLYGATQDSNTYDCLFQYLLVCPSNNLSCLSFPKSYNSWRDSSLLSPSNGELVQDAEYTFSLGVERAVNVFVLIGWEKHPLQRSNGHMWTGTVSTGDASPHATVIAEYQSETGLPYFNRLLEYDIL